MSTTAAQSTYTQLIQDVRLDVNEEEKLSTLANELIQYWINKAQERICDLVEVQDKYVLGLNDGTADYNFQDRPAISGATNATPVVVTAASHGLSNLDRISVRGVLGNTTANGRYQVASVVTNTFQLKKYADISSVSYSSGTVTITTSEEHPFATGESVTISGVLGMTDLNATFSVTVTSTTTFTVSLTTTQTYTSGGVCISDTIGNGTYTSGGRFWRDDEIPTFVKDIRFFQRTWSTSYKPDVKMMDMAYVLYQQKMDTDVNKLYWDYNSPFLAAIGMENSIRFLHTYPAATYDQNATLTCILKVTSRIYDSDSLSTNIILPYEYEDAIKAFVKMNIYGWLKDKLSRTEWASEFTGEINRLRLRTTSHPVFRVSYT